jgi:hypothetical protein
MSRFFLVCAGGALGTGLRYLIANAAPRLVGTSAATQLADHSVPGRGELRRRHGVRAREVVGFGHWPKRTSAGGRVSAGLLSRPPCRSTVCGHDDQGGVRRMEPTTAITPIFLILLWRRQLYGQRRFYAITN